MDDNENHEIDLSAPATPATLAIPAMPETSGLLVEALEKGGSHVWEHFTKDSDFKTNKKAICNHCNKTYTCSGGSTSNLSKHLKKHSVHKEQEAGTSVIDLLRASKASIIYLFIYLFL